jgi:hypothetical protein
MQPRWRAVKRWAAVLLGLNDPRPSRPGRLWQAPTAITALVVAVALSSLFLEAPPADPSLALANSESIPAAQLPPTRPPGPNAVPPTRPALVSADAPPTRPPALAGPSSDFAPPTRPPAVAAPGAASNLPDTPLIPEADSGWLLTAGLGLAGAILLLRRVRARR